MRNRGALAIGAMVLVGVALAMIAVWFHYERGRRCLELWGVESGNRIRHAPTVWALQLKPWSDSESAARPEEGSLSEEPLKIGERSWRVVERRDISSARGLVHARHALVVDANYLWSESPNKPQNADAFTYAYLFEDGVGKSYLVFNFGTGGVLSSDGKQGQLTPRLAHAEQAFLARELGQR